MTLPNDVSRCLGHAVDDPQAIVWLGVSVEDRRAADERIPLLLQAPAAVRFLSCEPLLGPLDLRTWLGIWQFEEGEPWSKETGADLDWVIVGGESGHGARPMHPNWARSLRDQCQAAGPAYPAIPGAQMTRPINYQRPNNDAQILVTSETIHYRSAAIEGLRTMRDQWIREDAAKTKRENEQRGKSLRAAWKILGEE